MQSTHLQLTAHLVLFVSLLPGFQAFGTKGDAETIPAVFELVEVVASTDHKMDDYLKRLRHSFKKYRSNIHILNLSALRIQRFWLRRRDQKESTESTLSLDFEEKGEDYQ